MTIQELARHPETIAIGSLDKLSEAVVHKSLLELCAECEGSTDNQLLLGLLEYVDGAERLAEKPELKLRKALGEIAVSKDTIGEFKDRITRDTLIDADELVALGSDRAINVMGSVLSISYIMDVEHLPFRRQYLTNIRHSAQTALEERAA